MVEAREGGGRSLSSDRTRLVYLLAASHSGSTLLAQLIGSHPDVATAGELKVTSLGDPERYRCSCGTLIRQCGFWGRVSESMARRGQVFDVTRAGTHFGAGASPLAHRLLRPLHRGPALEALRDLALALTPGWRASLRSLQERNAALAASVVEVTGKAFVVDSSKIAVRLKYLLRNPALEVRVVRIIRDGRGVALTHLDPARFADAKDPRLRGGGLGDGRESERLTMADAAREWRRSNEEAEAVLDGLRPFPLHRGPLRAPLRRSCRGLARDLLLPRRGRRRHRHPPGAPRGRKRHAPRLAGRREARRELAPVPESRGPRRPSSEWPET